jgi:hypothetical protein
MKKYEVTVEEARSEELLSLLNTLPYVKDVHESENSTAIYSLVPQHSLAEDWLLEGDAQLKKWYGK